MRPLRPLRTSPADELARALDDQRAAIAKHFGVPVRLLRRSPPSPYCHHLPTVHADGACVHCGLQP